MGQIVHRFWLIGSRQPRLFIAVNQFRMVMKWLAAAITLLLIAKTIICGTIRG